MGHHRLGPSGSLFLVRGCSHLQRGSCQHQSTPPRPNKKQAFIRDTVAYRDRPAATGLGIPPWAGAVRREHDCLSRRSTAAHHETCMPYQTTSKVSARVQILEARPGSLPQSTVFRVQQIALGNAVSLQHCRDALQILCTRIHLPPPPPTSPKCPPLAC